jgi:hypothetical protein
MPRWILASVPVLVLLGISSPARADKAPPPDPAPAAQKVKLVVVVDANAKEPRLVIPRSLANPPKKADAGLSLPTVVAGVALTLGIVSAGFWFIRRGPGRSIAAGVVVLALFALGVSALYADVGVPRPRPVKLPADVQLQEDVLVEFTDKGDTIRLVVNNATPIKVEKTEESKKE